ncbi:hypothetical protein ACFZBZ_00435 [Streptomyces sp. NPDC008196]|uniref:hypothetical protein n=1 Tax=Streptomyces sp. NPDC008196 TaxID=3364819 RepID=UPI0036ED2924
MKIRAILADTGRAAGAAANLLNAGWTNTTAIPLPQGAFTLPQQTLAVFVEAPWDQLNRPLRLILELKDDDDKIVELNAPQSSVPARVEHPLIVAPVPNAPNGVPGMATVVADFGGGTFRIPSARKRYIWHVNVGDATDEVGFWVDAPVEMPKLGI